MTSPLLRANGPLIGDLYVPGDKSVSHRVTLMPLLAGAPCRASGWLDSADTRASLAAVRALGAQAELQGDVLTVDARPAAAAMGGRGDSPLEIDCANSGTTARLLMGLLAGIVLLCAILGRQLILPCKDLQAEKENSPDWDSLCHSMV